MVEAAFLAVLAIAFFVILIIILNSGNNTTQTPVKEKQKKQPAKEKKPKGPKKSALKKDKRPGEIKEWTGVDTAAKDAQEMLEFLKGKDPVEIAKQHVIQPKQQTSNKKKGNNKKPKEEVETLSSEDSASEVGIEEGFSLIAKKPKTGKKPTSKKGENQENKDKDKDKDKSSKMKWFFKEEEQKEAERKAEKKAERKARREKKIADGEIVVTEEGEKRKRPQGDRDQKPRENRPKQPRDEKDPNKPPKERKERKERSEGEEPRKKEQPQRRAFPTAPPNVKYDEADLSDILNSITQDYDKPKPQTHRVGTIFSKIPRSIVTSILSKLEASDLTALSEVNYYFSALARREIFWKDLLLRDFGIKDIGKYRSFRVGYKAEYKKRKQQKKKKEKEIVPQDESKDSEKPTKQKKKVENSPPNNPTEIPKETELKEDQE